MIFGLFPDRYFWYNSVLIASLFAGLSLSIAVASDSAIEQTVNNNIINRKNPFSVQWKTSAYTPTLTDANGGLLAHYLSLKYNMADWSIGVVASGMNNYGNDEALWQWLDPHLRLTRTKIINESWLLLTLQIRHFPNLTNAASPFNQQTEFRAYAFQKLGSVGYLLHIIRPRFFWPKSSAATKRQYTLGSYHEYGYPITDTFIGNIIVSPSWTFRDDSPSQFNHLTSQMGATIKLPGKWQLKPYLEFRATKPSWQTTRGLLILRKTIL